jgi:hypothetical protein
LLLPFAVSALEADIADTAAVVDDEPHRHPACRTDRWAIILFLILVVAVAHPHMTARGLVMLRP